jgi:peptidoglycan/LPS O-acetylase OafA/YrhL
MGAHLGQILDVGMEKKSIASRIMIDGWIGVDLFFVLSGFLITGIILKERSREDFWSKFYLRRAFRILPAFVTVFGITLVAVHFSRPHTVSTGYVLSAIFFLANWSILSHPVVPMLSHLWSLAVEEQFYFLWPPAARRLSATAILKLALALTVACELLRIVLTLAGVSPDLQYGLTLTHFDGLTIGAALAAGITLPGVYRFLAGWWQRIALLAIFLLAVSLLFLHSSFPVLNPQILRIPPAILLTSMLIYGAVESALPSPLSKFFGSDMMTYLGRRSYALYLINRPIQVAISDCRDHGYLARLPQGIPINLLLMVFVTAVSLLLTEISWRLIESPAQDIRRRWMRRIEEGTRTLLSEETEISQLVGQNRSLVTELK